MIVIRALLGLALCALCVAPLAAADDELATAVGTVTLNGKPLAKGRIFFHVCNGQFIGAKVKDGKYKVERLPVGKHLVSVEYPGVPAQYADEAKSGMFFQADKGISTYDLDLKSR